MLAVLVAAASGALLSQALPPTGVWPLFLALVPLFVLVAEAPTARRAFWLGASFALPFFAIYILWLPRSFSQPTMLGSFFWGVFPLLLAALCLIWGAVTFLARLLGGRGAGTLWLLPGFWVLTEWLRTQGYLGFPWGTLGYLWLGSPAAQVASTVGVYGLSLLATAAAALVAAPFVRPMRAPARRGRDRRRTLVGAGAGRGAGGSRHAVGRGRPAAAAAPSPTAPPCWCRATSTPSVAPSARPATSACTPA